MHPITWTAGAVTTTIHWHDRWIADLQRPNACNPNGAWRSSCLNPYFVRVMDFDEKKAVRYIEDNWYTGLMLEANTLASPDMKWE